MVFSQKLLTATFTLGAGNFAGGGNSLTLSGLRMSCEYFAVTGDGQAYLDNLTIYGMTLSHMNALSVIGTTYNRMSQHNTVTVQAGSAAEGMSTVCMCDIIEAAPDGGDQPNVRFMVTGKPGAFNARKPIAPTTRKGSVDGASLVQQLAQQMGYRFENSGVSVQIRNPYLHGTGISQVRQIIDAMSCSWLIHNGTLAIWPSGKSRSGSTPLVSPQTGMVGYPQFQQAKVVVKSYYRPDILPGGNIQVQSAFTAACGIWGVPRIDYSLECLVPHGQWFQTMVGFSQAGVGLASGDAP